MMDKKIEEKDCLAKWITKTHLKLRANLNQKIKKYNLTVEQRQILLLLFKNSSMTQREICKETLAEPSNINVTLKRMEQNNYILKQKHPKDKRTTIICPSKKALELKNEIINIGKNNLEIFLSDIEEEKEITIEVLKKVFKKIEEKETN